MMKKQEKALTADWSIIFNSTILFSLHDLNFFSFLFQNVLDDFCIHGVVTWK